MNFARGEAVQNEFVAGFQVRRWRPEFIPIGGNSKTRGKIEAFFNVLSTTLCELIDVNFETFSAVIEKAVGKSPLLNRAKEMLSNLRFVFVDEAQDMNRVFVDVLKEIR